MLSHYLKMTICGDSHFYFFFALKENLFKYNKISLNAFRYILQKIYFKILENLLSCNLHQDPRKKEKLLKYLFCQNENEWILLYRIKLKEYWWK